MRTLFTKRMLSQCLSTGIQECWLNTRLVSMEVINLMLKHSVNFSGFQIGTTWNDTRNLMFIKPICKQSLLDPSVKHWDDILVSEATLAVKLNIIQGV
ncbi:MAG: hypothetical protein ACR5K3_02085 [Wolbachia sp.]